MLQTICIGLLLPALVECSGYEGRLEAILRGASTNDDVLRKAGCTAKRTFLSIWLTLHPVPESHKFETNQPSKPLAMVLLGFCPALVTTHRSLHLSAKCPQVLMELPLSDNTRTYAPKKVFREDYGPNNVERLVKELACEENRKNSLYYAGSPWSSPFFRIGLFVSAYMGYPFLAEVLALLPTTDSRPSSNFFGLLSVVFGTLIASVVSDASTRLANLRAIAVDEVTILLPLVHMLEARLSAEKTGEGDQELLNACFAEIWDHTSMLVTGTRTEELRSIAGGSDCLVKLLLRLQGAEANRPELSFAVSAAQRVIETRGRRLSLENAGIPDLELTSLRAQSFAIAIVFAYLTLDPKALGIDKAYNFQFQYYEFNIEDPKFFMTASFGPRVLFAYLVNSLAFLQSLSADLNRPFDGYSRIESGTLVATLLQLRSLMARHLGYSLDAGLKMGSRVTASDFRS